jgi:hypothetical protein
LNSESVGMTEFMRANQLEAENEMFVPGSLCDRSEHEAESKLHLPL